MCMIILYCTLTFFGAYGTPLRSGFWFFCAICTKFFSSCCCQGPAILELGRSVSSFSCHCQSASRRHDQPASLVFGCFVAVAVAVDPEEAGNIGELSGEIAVVECKWEGLDGTAVYYQ